MVLRFLLFWAIVKVEMYDCGFATDYRAYRTITPKTPTVA